MSCRYMCCKCVGSFPKEEVERNYTDNNNGWSFICKFCLNKRDNIRFQSASGHVIEMRDDYDYYDQEDFGDKLKKLQSMPSGHFTVTELKFLLNPHLNESQFNRNKIDEIYSRLGNIINNEKFETT